MKTSQPAKDILRYLDYRQYLRDRFQLERECDPDFSNRTFARRAGIPLSSSSFISKVLLGKRNLTSTLRVRFVKGLGLADAEARYFELLVQFGQARGMEEKNHFFHELVRLRGPRIRIVEQDQYRFYEKWLHAVVWAYVGMNPSEKNPASIAKALFPPVSPPEVEESLKLLLDLGLVKKLANGYAVTENHIATPREIRDLAAKRHVTEMTRLALDVYEQVPASEREYNSLTMYLSPAGYRAVKERIKGFREELRALLDRDSGEDRVYTLTMQLFPNTIRRGPRR